MHAMNNKKDDSIDVDEIEWGGPGFIATTPEQRAARSAEYTRTRESRKGTTFRIVTLVDITASTVEEAYEIFCEGMVAACAARMELEWETSDEWFDLYDEPVGWEEIERVTRS